ncbi:MAG: DUF3187 family protein [Victivallales bacterium]|nr:DUF3187 family protein [Victivallales bacterium]
MTKNLRNWMILAAVALPTALFAQASEKYANAMIWAKPLTNPVYNDFAMIKREVNLLYAYQTLPSHIESAGLTLELDGDANVFAIQAEIPLTESLSLVANKSGFTDLNPEATLTKQEGMNDLSAGLKWAFLSCESYTLALRATVELPIGNTDVLQGNGDGNISPALLGTYLTGNHAFNAVVGAILPLDDDEESTVGYASVAHAYRLTEWMSTHLELNWVSVLESGNGDATFDDQVAANENILPAVLDFEGGDLINLGAAGSEDHRDFVSAAIGARFQLHESISLGVAYELPLTSKEHGLMDQRVTLHLTATF